MSKSSKSSASEHLQLEGYEGHFEDFGPYTVGFETYTAALTSFSSAPVSTSVTMTSNSPASSSSTRASRASRSPPRYARTIAKARPRRSSAMATYPTPAKC